MEDHNQSKHQADSANGDNIVDLSADMALKDQSKHQVIDLTNDIDDRTGEPVKSLPSEALSNDNAPEPAENKSLDEKTGSKNIPPEVELELLDQGFQTETNTEDLLEELVGSTDNAVEADTGGPEPDLTADDQLLDDMSDITLAVDKAVGNTDHREPGTEEQPLHLDPAEGDSMEDQTLAHDDDSIDDDFIADLSLSLDDESMNDEAIEDLTASLDKDSMDDDFSEDLTLSLDDESTNDDAIEDLTLSLDNESAGDDVTEDLMLALDDESIGDGATEDLMLALDDESIGDGATEDLMLALDDASLDDDIAEDLTASLDDASMDENAISAQAAELDAALSGDIDAEAPKVHADDTEDIELVLDEKKDNDVIELLDIVNPLEIEASEDDATDENDVIELTQIVDPSELEDPALDALDMSAGADLDLAAEPGEGEEELSLASSDDDAMLLEGTDTFPVADDDLLDPSDLDNLFDDEPQVETSSLSGEIFAEESDADMATGLSDELADELAVPDDELALPDDDLDIGAIPALDDSEGLFDIENQFATPEIPENKAAAVDMPDHDTTPDSALEDKEDNQDQIIQLADILKASNEQEPAAGLAAPASSEEDIMEEEQMDTEPQAATKALAMDIAEDMAKSDTVIADEKLEAAVEHIIQTKYADKIERMIANAVEEAVTREIENIKRTLTDTDDPLA